MNLLFSITVMSTASRARESISATVAPATPPPITAMRSFAEPETFHVMVRVNCEKDLVCEVHSQPSARTYPRYKDLSFPRYHTLSSPCRCLLCKCSDRPGQHAHKERLFNTAMFLNRVVKSFVPFCPKQRIFNQMHRFITDSGFQVKFLFFEPVHELFMTCHLRTSTGAVRRHFFWRVL